MKKIPKPRKVKEMASEYRFDYKKAKAKPAAKVKSKAKAPTKKKPAAKKSPAKAKLIKKKK